MNDGRDKLALETLWGQVAENRQTNRDAPTMVDLADFLPYVPDSVMVEANARLAAVMDTIIRVGREPANKRSPTWGNDLERAIADTSPEHNRGLLTILALYLDAATDVSASWVADSGRVVATVGVTVESDGRNALVPSSLTVTLSPGIHHVSESTAVVDSHWWQALGREGNPPPHPLWPILDALIEHWPETVQPETRQDKRIWAKVETIPPDAGRRQGMIFAGDHAGIETNGQLKLVPDVEPTQAPLLDMVDSAGLPVMAQGRGASLALRFAVHSLLSVRMEDRGEDRTIWLPIIVRDLMQGLFPNGWQRGRHWPRVQTMLLSMHEYIYPLPGGVWRPWNVPWAPDNPGLDEPIRVGINLIRQVSSGPEIDLAALAQLGAASGPGFRAYLAASAISWIDGVTRVPVAKRRGQWRYTQDLSKYPVITQDDRRRLAFGPHDTKHRTKAQINEPWENIPGMRVVDKKARDPKKGVEGWRIVPEIIIPATSDK